MSKFLELGKGYSLPSLEISQNFNIGDIRFLLAMVEKNNSVNFLNPFDMFSSHLDALLIALRLVAVLDGGTPFSLHLESILTGEDISYYELSVLCNTNNSFADYMFTNAEIRSLDDAEKTENYITNDCHNFNEDTKTIMMLLIKNYKAQHEYNLKKIIEQKENK